MVGRNKCQVNKKIPQIVQKDKVNQPVSGSEFNQDIFVEAQQILVELKEQFEQLSVIHKTSVQIYGRLQGLNKRLNDKKEGLKEEFAKIKREINLPNFNPDNFISLTKTMFLSSISRKMTWTIRPSMKKLSRK